MAKKKPEPTVLPASPPIPLFERPAEGEIAVRVRTAGNNRAAGLKEAFAEISKIVDQKSTAGGKERSRVKELLKANGLSSIGLSIARRLMKEDATTAIGAINDATLILAELGKFDEFEQGAQAEEQEARAASVDAAERMNGEPTTDTLRAALAHGEQAATDKAPLTACPYDEGTATQKWWHEGWHRVTDAAQTKAAA